MLTLGIIAASLVLGGCPIEPGTGGAAPKVTSSFPTTGPTRGGTRVQIKGVGLGAVVKVRFGNVDGADLLVESETELYVTAPASFPGIVPVELGTATLAVAATPDGFFYSDDDSDGDGLTNAQEDEGWFVWVDYFGLGLGVDTFGNVVGLSETTIASDPSNPDTDDDGLGDLEEFQNKSDPTLADTDGDGLTDGEEVHRWRTAATSVDTDHDSRGPEGNRPPNPALFDGAELHIDPNDETRSAGLLATSPTLDDTDGDGRTDFEELDSSVFRPLLAELPLLSIEVVDEVDIRLNVEYAEEVGTTREYGTTIETGRTTGVSGTVTSGQETTESTSRSQTDHLGGHADLTIGSEGGFPSGAKVKSSAEVGVDYFSEWAREDSTSSTSSTEVSNTTSSETSESTAYSELQSDSQVLTETSSTGSLSVGVQIRNIGDVSFAISNIALAVRMWIPGSDPSDPSFAGSFRTVGTLLPAYDAATALGPGEATPVVQAAAEDLNADLIREFLADPRRLYFSSPGFSLIDANGRDFAFLREVTRARTASITLDFGDGQREDYVVATEVNRDNTGERTGLRLIDAFAQLGIDYATLVQSPSGSTVLTKVRGTPADTPTPALFWSVFLTTRDGTVPDDGPNFEDLRLRAGDRVVVALSRDEDEDGLFSAEEEHFGTSDTSVDADGDGIGDAEEAMPTIQSFDPLITIAAGWDVALADGVTYRVVSDPAVADLDRDQLNDGAERAAGTDPRKPDTDDDGTPDNLDPFPLQRGNILLVRPGGPGVAGQGETWDTAYDQIYEALYEAFIRNASPQADDDVNEIWVAAGIYFPSDSIADGPLNLVSNVALYGGFTGTETKLSQRNADPLSSGTFITGDRDGDGQYDAGDDKRLISAFRLGSQTVLDGFVLTHANATDSPSYGGALRQQGGSLIVQNCVFTGNRAYNGGAAIYTESYDDGSESDAPTLEISSCSFLQNALIQEVDNKNADNFGGALYLTTANSLVPGRFTIQDCLFQGNLAQRGGALCVLNSECTVDASTFTDNRAYFSVDVSGPTEPRGGAIYNLGALRISNSLFQRNYAGGSLSSFEKGGAIANNGPLLSITQCVLANNTATGAGGALFLGNIQGSATVTNCTFSNNGSGLGVDGGSVFWFQTRALSTRLENNIFDELVSFAFEDDTGTQPSYDSLILQPIVRYCYVSDGRYPTADGIANLSGVGLGPPGIVNAAGGDFRLAGDSVCIDRGNNAADADIGTAGFQLPLSFDFGGATRITNGDGFGAAAIDIGAFEYGAGAP